MARCKELIFADGNIKNKINCNDPRGSKAPWVVALGNKKERNRRKEVTKSKNIMRSCGRYTDGLTTRDGKRCALNVRL